MSNNEDQKVDANETSRSRTDNAAVASHNCRAVVDDIDGTERIIHLPAHSGNYKDITNVDVKRHNHTNTIGADMGQNHGYKNIDVDDNIYANNDNNGPDSSDVDGAIDSGNIRLQHSASDRRSIDDYNIE